MSSDRFYQELTGFSDFGGINDLSHFAEVPADWTVVITDVKGSTKAIEAGRYKDVNTIGAAAIAAVQNAVGGLDYPFVFGGDGATLLIPPAAVDAVRRSLAGLKAISDDQFGLGLRVGVVPVSVVNDAGAKILVAKHELPGKSAVAIFRGGGLTAAEALVKGTDDYELPTGNASDASLEGLSCRWKPIPNRGGTVLSLLVVARGDDDDAVYGGVLEHLASVFTDGMESANPVNIDQMSFKTFRQALADELRYDGSRLTYAFLYRMFELIAAFAIFKFGMPGIGFDARDYENNLGAHSDYRKFDDALRMVLDCTPEQVTAIRDGLEARYQKGELFYGLFESSTSLMTCLVPDPNPSKHIHFIDGGSGGYAMAAKQLKGQMKAAAE